MERPVASGFSTKPWRVLESREIEVIVSVNDWQRLTFTPVVLSGSLIITICEWSVVKRETYHWQLGTVLK